MIHRRQFLTALGSAGLALRLPHPIRADAPPAGRGLQNKIALFSKPIRHLTATQTADLVGEVGWDGIECTVRQGGQVLPERVEEDLPALAEALSKDHREIFSIATDISARPDPANEKVLRTASRLGIRFYRLAHLDYQANLAIPPQLESWRARFRELAELNRELGLCAIYENHSGRHSIGGPVWDIYELLRGLDARSYGVAFDIGHATIEGGTAWPVNFRLIQPFLRAVYVKDFYWTKQAGQWQASWCPLGQGMVNPEFFKMVRASRFGGPIVQFHEYHLGSQGEMVRAFKHDLAVLRDWMRQAAG